MGTIIPENIKTIGREMTTLFAFFEIACELNVCQWEMTKNFAIHAMPDSRKYYYGVELRKLLYITTISTFCA